MLAIFLAVVTLMMSTMTAFATEQPADGAQQGAEAVSAEGGAEATPTPAPEATPTPVSYTHLSGDGGSHADIPTAFRGSCSCS